MFAPFKKSLVRIALLVSTAALVVTALLTTSTPAQAHCDSEQGPVASSARLALEKGDIKQIAPYVKPEYEKELNAAFKQARAARGEGKNAKLLSEQYFVETAIRLHRMGEGAPYTGMTDEATPEIIVVADKGLTSGSMTELNDMLNKAVAKSIEEKYHAVVEARENAEKLGTVEAHRERVEAELALETYVYGLYSNITAAEPHGEGGAH